MTFVGLLALAATVLGTSILSGMFGMAGGLILMGALLAFLPVPAAMALHGAAQLSANGWRAVLWRKHILWRTSAAYCVGGLIAVAIWSVILFVPSRPLALISLGLSPYLLMIAPARLQADPARDRDGVLYGVACVSFMMLTGVAGPLLDSFFLKGGLDRRQIVATKGVCQVFGHLAKIVYFGVLVDPVDFGDWPAFAVAIVVASIGTTLGGMALERMSNADFRIWADRIIATVCTWYVVHGLYLWLFA
ncbi:MAG: TSUP family transporter [Tagaea sp.]